MRYKLSYPLFRRGTWDSASLSDLFKVTSSETVKVRIRIQANSKTWAVTHDIDFFVETLPTVLAEEVCPRSHVYSLSLWQMITPVVDKMLEEWPFII